MDLLWTPVYLPFLAQSDAVPVICQNRVFNRPDQGVVRTEQALCLDNRYQPARRSIHACCAFQSVGIVLRTRSSRRSPAGWRPARMARWIVGDRNARRSNRRSYRGPGTDLINGAPERLCSIIACAVRSALMRTGSRRVAGTTAGLIVARRCRVPNDAGMVRAIESGSAGAEPRVSPSRRSRLIGR